MHNRLLEITLCIALFDIELSKVNNGCVQNFIITIDKIIAHYKATKHQTTSTTHNDNNYNNKTTKHPDHPFTRKIHPDSSEMHRDSSEQHLEPKIEIFYNKRMTNLS